MLRLLAVALLAALPAAQSAPRLLVDVNTEPVAPSSSHPDDFARFGAWVFFSADDGVHGRELFRTNGMAATTGLFADLRPGPDGSDPRDLVQVGTRLFLTADDGVHGRELWISDGTPAGTRMLDEIVPGPNGFTMRLPVVVRSRLVFATNTELWVVDSMDPVPTRVAVSTPQRQWFTVSSGVRIQTTGGEWALFFVVGLYSGELWRSDGTLVGTTILASRGDWSGIFNPGAGVVSGGSFGLVCGTTRFIRTPVWITDGTPSGTVPTGFIPGIEFSAFRARTAWFDGALWVAGLPGDFAWRSDGTVSGTRAISTPITIPSAHAESIVGASATSLWMRASDITGRRLVRVDVGSTTPIDLGPMSNFAADVSSAWSPLGTRFLGTSPNVGLVAFDPQTNRSESLAGTPSTSRVRQPFVAYGRCYFAIRDPDLGTELGTVTATSTGTSVLVNLNSQPSRTNDTRASSYGRMDGRGIFGASWDLGSGAARAEATFVTDGTPQGTERIADGSWEGISARVGGDMVFTTGGGTALWRTDGNPGGTRRLPAPPTPILALVSHIDRLVAVTSDANALGLWRTDGTNWVLLGEEPAPSGVLCAQSLGGRVCVRTWGRTVAGSTPTALWVSDGTPIGTARIETGVRTSLNDQMVVFRDRAWFGEWAVTGARLWSSDGTVAGTRSEFPLPNSNIGGIRAARGRLYLLLGTQVYASDGTPNGLVRVTSSAYPGIGGRHAPFAVVDDRIVFDAYLAGAIRAVVSDGTVAGTRPLSNGLSRAEPMTEYVEAGQGRILFEALDATTQVRRVYVSDGTSSGTREVPISELGIPARSAGQPQLAYATAGGRLFFTRSDPFAGLEPHVIDLGATVERLSEGCGIGARRAELFATLGGSPAGGLSIEGRSSIGNVAQIVLSAPPMHPLAFPQNGACTLDVDPNAWVLLASLPIANQRFAQSWPLPDDPALYGLQAVVQGFVGPTNAPLGADFTNGLLLSLGQ